jgi:arylsulfatase A-like enzyme
VNSAFPLRTEASRSSRTQSAVISPNLLRRVLILTCMAVLVLSRPPRAGAQAAAARAEPDTNDWNLILISLTNTRADHLGGYGYVRDTSPNLDRLARKSLLFRQAFSHASWTLPAAISLFTSTYPFTHGMMNRELATPLPPNATTFIDVLKTNGYVTAAFVGSRDYAPQFGHTARFDTVFDPVTNPEQEDWKSYGVLEKTLPPARDWLRRNRDRKFVLLVQGYDTHCPFAVPHHNPRFDPSYQGTIDFTKCYWTFEPTPPVNVRAKSGRYEPVFLLKTKPTGGDHYDVPFHPEDVQHMIALYDGEIANADAMLGQLLDDVTNLGLARRTIILFYADHGDMFGKHGRFMRGGPLRGTFYDDVLRIPLIVHHPALPARSIEGLAQLIDLAPTILEWLGCGRQIPPSFQGKSLQPLLTGGGPVNRHVFAGSAFKPAERNPFFPHESVIYSVRNQRWKLIYEHVNHAAGPQDSFELYDLANDRDELKNRAEQNPNVLAELRSELLRWLSEIRADQFKPTWPPIDPRAPPRN